MIIKKSPHRRGKKKASNRAVLLVVMFFLLLIGIMIYLFRDKIVEETQRTSLIYHDEQQYAPGLNKSGNKEPKNRESVDKLKVQEYRPVDRRYLEKLINENK